MGVDKLESDPDSSQRRRRGKALAPQVKREAIGKLVLEYHLSERRACRLMGLSCDRYRHPPETDQMSKDLTGKIVEIAQARRRFVSVRSTPS